MDGWQKEFGHERYATEMEQAPCVHARLEGKRKQKRPCANQNTDETGAVTVGAACNITQRPPVSANSIAQQQSTRALAAANPPRGEIRC